jgi:hypothetical protein
VGKNPAHLHWPDRVHLHALCWGTVLGTRWCPLASSMAAALVMVPERRILYPDEAASRPSWFLVHAVSEVRISLEGVRSKGCYRLFACRLLAGVPPLAHGEELCCARGNGGDVLAGLPCCMRPALAFPSSLALRSPWPASVALPPADPPLQTTVPSVVFYLSAVAAVSSWRCSAVGLVEVGSTSGFRLLVPRSCFFASFYRFVSVEPGSTGGFCLLDPRSIDLFFSPLFLDLSFSRVSTDLFFSPSFLSRLSLRSFTGFPMRFPTPLLMRSAPLRS